MQHTPLAGLQDSENGGIQFAKTASTKGRTATVTADWTVTMTVAVAVTVPRDWQPCHASNNSFRFREFGTMSCMLSSHCWYTTA